VWKLPAWNTFIAEYLIAAYRNFQQSDLLTYLEDQPLATIG
jgi:hypothetical protein